MSMQPRPLAGKVALVTGGGRGIGCAIGRAFVARGMKVAIADLDAALVETTAREIDTGAIGLALDVTMRALRTNRVLTEIDHDTRRAYEARVR